MVPKMEVVEKLIEECGLFETVMAIHIACMDYAALAKEKGDKRGAHYWRKQEKRFYSLARDLSDDDMDPPRQ